MSAEAERDRILVRLAGGQRTVVSHEQLIESGVSRHAIAYRLQTEFLSPVFDRVYTVGCGVLPPLAREQAALLACGKGAFLSHLTSAAIWGMAPAREDTVHVSVPGRYRRSSRGLVVHRLAAVDPSELGRREGLPVSSPARVLLEVAATESSDVLEGVLDEAFGQRRVTVPAVEAVLARHPGSRGSARLRELIDPQRNRGMTRSLAERIMRGLVRSAGIDEPEVNAPLGRYTVDFMWRAQRLIVEIDGYNFHRGRGKFESDRARDAALTAAGWVVVRFTWTQLREQPELVLFRLGQIMGAISRRARAGS